MGVKRANIIDIGNSHVINEEQIRNNLNVCISDFLFNISGVKEIIHQNNQKKKKD
jgi:hypothetical protein